MKGSKKRERERERQREREREREREGLVKKPKKKCRPTLISTSSSTKLKSSGLTSFSFSTGRDIMRAR